MYVFFKRLIAAVSSLALAASMAAYMPVTTFAAQEVDNCNDDWLHAVGSKLYVKQGNQVWLTGANWFGFNCPENMPHGLWNVDVDKMLSDTAERGINVIRFLASLQILTKLVRGP